MALADKLVIPPKKHVDMVDNAGGYVREVTPGKPVRRPRDE